MIKTERQIKARLKLIHKAMDVCCKLQHIPIERQKYERLILESCTLNWVLNEKTK